MGKLVIAMYNKYKQIGKDKKLLSINGQWR